MECSKGNSIRNCRIIYFCDSQKLMSQKAIANINVAKSQKIEIAKVDIALCNFSRVF